MCREEGVTLRDLAASKEKPFEGFNLFGVVKETGVDDEGLADFSKHYPFPLYRDENLEFYQALGNRKLSLPTFNPWRLYKGYKQMSRRLKEKDLEGNLKGEGIKQGGVIVFGKDGKQRFAYAEETGSEIPVDDILAAVKSVKEEK